jgi:hypothetical protein
MAFTYTGVLATPIPYTAIPADAFPGGPGWERWQQQLNNEFAERWKALFEAHGVKYGPNVQENIRRLLFKLAAAHVPGFQVKGKPGPKGKAVVNTLDLFMLIEQPASLLREQAIWDSPRLAKLYSAVNEYLANKRERPASISQACRYLSKKEPWKSLLRQRGKNPAQALRGHYYDAVALGRKLKIIE